MTYLLTIIVLASIYDSWLSVRSGLVPMDEKNPMARFVLKWMGLPGLVLCKGIGTLIAVTTLSIVYAISPSVGLWATAGVAAFMTWLVAYLWWYSRP